METIESRNERARAYITKCRRRNIRKQRRRERNTSRMVDAIGRGTGIVALIMMGVLSGGWLA